MSSCRLPDLWTPTPLLSRSDHVRHTTMTRGWRKSRLLLMVLLGLLYMGLVSVLHIQSNSEKSEVVLLASDRESAPTVEGNSHKHFPKMEHPYSGSDKDAKERGNVFDRHNDELSKPRAQISEHVYRSVVLRRLSENRDNVQQTTPDEETDSPGRGQLTDEYIHQMVSDPVEKSKERNHSTQSTGTLPGTPPDVNPGDQEDQVEFVRLGDIYVYAVYLDERQFPQSPQVRVLVLKARPTMMTPQAAMTCEFQTVKGGQTVYHRSTCHAYEMCENHDKAFGGWIYSCSLPRGLEPKPTGVTLFYINQFPDHKQTFRKVFNFTMISNNSKDARHEAFTSQLHSPSHNYSKIDEFDTTINMSDGESRHFKEIKNKTLLKPITSISPTSIGVCVPPLFGQIVLIKLINFLEMCKILGADKITMYVHDVDEHILQFLRYYSRKNKRLLTLVHWQLPDLRRNQSSDEFSSHHSSSTGSSQSSSFSSTLPSRSLLNWWASATGSQALWNRGQLLSMQHCLYNNMLPEQWLLFMDIDEMLVPHGRSEDGLHILDWKQLIKYNAEAQPSVKTSVKYNNSNDLTVSDQKESAALNKDYSGDKLLENSNVISRSDIPRPVSNHNGNRRHSVAALSFQSAFFQQDFQTQASNTIDYFQYLHRTRTTYPERAKLFVRPQLVLETGIHHLSKPLQEHFHQVGVGTGMALVHHYRKCVSRSDHSKVECDVLVKDDAMLRYEARLTLASRQVLADAVRALWS